MQQGNGNLCQPTGGITDQQYPRYIISHSRNDAGKNKCDRIVLAEDCFTTPRKRQRDEAFHDQGCRQPDNCAGGKRVGQTCADCTRGSGIGSREYAAGQINKSIAEMQVPSAGACRDMEKIGGG